MAENADVTLDVLYNELKLIRKELNVVEHALIPTEELSQAELEEHRRDLEDALTHERVNIKDLKR